jgi:hypothetical protein
MGNFCLGVGSQQFPSTGLAVLFCNWLPQRSVLGGSSQFHQYNLWYSCWLSWPLRPGSQREFGSHLFAIFFGFCIGTHHFLYHSQRRNPGLSPVQNRYTAGLVPNPDTACIGGTEGSGFGHYLCASFSS